jgi:SAM-dependent methyltransferase
VGELLTEKFILDATAGFRMMWFNKKHPNCIYLDNRPECEPDIVGDFRDLKQFSDETFRLIVFDPPHILRYKDTEHPQIMAKYGYLRPDTWKWDLARAAKELWRVLKPYGILIFKWSTQYIPSNEVLSVFPQKPLVYQISANMKKTHSKKRKEHSTDVQTLWFCFMKIPNEHGIDSEPTYKEPRNAIQTNDTLMKIPKQEETKQ